MEETFVSGYTLFCPRIFPEYVLAMDARRVTTQVACHEGRAPRMGLTTCLSNLTLVRVSREGLQLFQDLPYNGKTPTTTNFSKADAQRYRSICMCSLRTIHVSYLTRTTLTTLRSTPSGPSSSTWMFDFQQCLVAREYEWQAM